MNEKNAVVALQFAMEAVERIQQLYNEFLTAVDQAHEIQPLEVIVPRLRELQKNMNDLYDLKLESAPSQDSPERSKRQWFKPEKDSAAGSIWNQQREFNATIVHLMNELIEYLTTSTRQLRNLLEFQVRFFQEITPWIDVKIEALRRQMHREVAAELNRLSAVVGSLDHSRADLNPLIAQFRAFQEQMDEKKSELERRIQEMWFAVRSNQSSVPTVRPELHELTRLRVELDELRSKLAAPKESAGSKREETSNSESSLQTDLRYAIFEKVFRGNSEWLIERMKTYVPYFLNTPEPVVDIGCGHGEFLRVMKEIGKSAFGIDMNRYESDQVKESGLKIVNQDALLFLQQQQPESIGSAFCAQVVEHMAPDKVHALLSRLLVVMKPGSALIVETINPLSIFAYHHLYFKDPTHIFPVHPETLVFLFRYAGFQNVEFHRLSPVPDQQKFDSPPPGLNKTLTGYLKSVIDRLNDLIFDDLEYFVIGYRP